MAKPLARRFLEERGSELGDRDYERLCAMITAHEGGDPRTELEALYQKTNSLIDLRDLVRHLGQVGNWSALRSLLEEMFGRERTIENACALIDCMKRDPSGVDNDIVALLKANPDLVDRSSDLASAKVQALLRVGCLKEARVINGCLLLERKHPLDLQLDINLALQSGDWERFPVIIEREWPNRDKHKPAVLMHLASLAAEADATPGRAVELARLAVRKAPNDPHVLVNAYALTTRLGCESKSQAEWVHRAFELSSDRGPVWQMDVRTMIEEMIPAHRERAHKVNEDLLHGKLPLHVATAGMNASLSHVLMDLPHRNTEQRDGRQRVVVPIVSDY